MFSYLITDPKFYGDTPKSLISTLLNASKKHKIDYACLRDKNAANYKELAREFVLACNALGIKPILHTFWELASVLGAYGTHFASCDFTNIASAKEKKLSVIASAHSLLEARNAIESGADFVTVSPIFYAPNKNEPLGLVKLKEITDKIPNKCIALGGILKNSQVEECQSAGAAGFASIRYFLK